MAELVMRHISYAGSILVFLFIGLILYTGYLAIQTYLLIVETCIVSCICVFVPAMFFCKLHAMWMHDHYIPIQPPTTVKRISRKKEEV